MQTEEAIEIAKKNDAFRRSGFGVTVTPGVQVLEDLGGLIDEIRQFMSLPKTMIHMVSMTSVRCIGSEKRCSGKYRITTSRQNTQKTRFRWIVGGS